jgi:hypothetical protein
LTRTKRPPANNIKRFIFFTLIKLQFYTNCKARNGKLLQMTNVCFKCNVLLTTMYVTGWHFLLMPIIPTFEFFTQLLKVIWNHNNNILQAVKSDTAYTRKNMRNILPSIISGFLHLTSQDKTLDKCQRNYVAVCYWWSIGW